MRSKSIGRKQPAAHSIVATLKTEKPETTGTTNFFKRALAPLHFFSSANFDRRLDQIIQMQLQKHSCAKAPIALAPIIFLIRWRFVLAFCPCRRPAIMRPRLAPLRSVPTVPPHL
jgi:hypothetical protein